MQVHFITGINCRFVEYRFTTTHNEGDGWVMKAPFTTNSSYCKFAKTFDNLVSFLVTACRTDYGSIPYMMIQACMNNRKEYKVILLGGEPAYLARIAGHSSKRSSNGINKAFSKPPHTEIMEFAKLSMQRCSQLCPNLLTDGLFRVDIFITIDKRLVVNEFESLEANYPSNIETEAFAAHQFMQTYWARKIIACFANLNI